MSNDILLQIASQNHLHVVIGALTLIEVVYVPTGIVMSGDSRTTGSNTQQVPNPQTPNQQVTVQMNVVLSDSADKIFLVSGLYGIATFGEAFVSNLPIAHYIEAFQAQLQPAPTSVLNLANSLLSFFRNLQPVPNVNFFVVGYDQTVPFVYVVEVRGNIVRRLNIDQNTQQVVYGTLNGGDTAVVTRLLSQQQFNPPFQVMNLQDAVDFSRHLIRTTIDQMRFEPRFATVGGPIDTLIVTSSEAKFLDHKTLHVSV